MAADPWPSRSHVTGHISGTPYRVCPRCARKFFTPQKFIAGTSRDSVENRAYRAWGVVGPRRVLLESWSDIEIRLCPCGGGMYRHLRTTREPRAVDPERPVEGGGEETKGARRTLGEVAQTLRNYRDTDGNLFWDNTDESAVDAAITRHNNDIVSSIRTATALCESSAASDDILIASGCTVPGDDE